MARTVKDAAYLLAAIVGYDKVIQTCMYIKFIYVNMYIKTCLEYMYTYVYIYTYICIWKYIYIPFYPSPHYYIQADNYTSQIPWTVQPDYVGACKLGGLTGVKVGYWFVYTLTLWPLSSTTLTFVFQCCLVSPLLLCYLCLVMYLSYMFIYM
jgi:hypothetical protein